MCDLSKDYGNPYEYDSDDDEVSLSIVRLGAKVKGVVRKRVLYTKHDEGGGYLLLEDEDYLRRVEVATNLCFNASIDVGNYVEIEGKVVRVKTPLIWG